MEKLLPPNTLEKVYEKLFLPKITSFKYAYKSIYWMLASIDANDLLIPNGTCPPIASIIINIMKVISPEINTVDKLFLLLIISNSHNFPKLS